jgi:hypothetical protein
MADTQKAGAERHEHVKRQHEVLTEEELIIAKKLKRKIDIRIMPLVILVYLMNYIDRYISTSSSAFNTCDMTDRPSHPQKQLRSRPPPRPRSRPKPRRRPIPSRPLHPLRRLHPHASPLEPSPQLHRPPLLVSRRLHHRLGPRVRLHIAGPELRWHRRRAVYSWRRGGAVFCRRAVLSEQVVYQGGIGETECDFLCGVVGQWRVWEFDCCGDFEWVGGGEGVECVAVVSFVCFLFLSLFS